MLSPSIIPQNNKKEQEMFTFLSTFFQKRKIDCFAALPLSECRIQKPYLLEREGIADGSVLLVAVPYYTPACQNKDRNLSAYAVSLNYHDYFEELFEELLKALRKQFPNNRFAYFSDHSPIAEVEAASKAGLGVIGKNHLLLTHRYSSYIFLGELFTDAVLPYHIEEITYCEDCGACQRVCPAEECGICLSALTQKKGKLTATEEKSILKYGSVWGCDLCQEACPHTKKAIESGSIYSPVAFFAQHPIPHLTRAELDAMDDATFSKRAYSWRGRAVIERNLELFERHEQK